MDYQTLTYTTLPRTEKYEKTCGCLGLHFVWGEQESIMQTTNLLTLNYNMALFIPTTLTPLGQVLFKHFTRTETRFK